MKEKEDPVHNFDAVYVAVGAGGVKNLRLILPYSAVYKMRKTIFLGDSGWNAKNLKRAVGETLRYCLLYTSPSPRDRQKSRMPSSA